MLISISGVEGRSALASDGPVTFDQLVQVFDGNRVLLERPRRWFGELSNPVTPVLYAGLTELESAPNHLPVGRGE